MTDLDLADAILRHALELQRLSAHEEAEALAILKELEHDLRTLLASRALSEASRRDIEALVKEADEAIAARYQQIPGLLDTDALVLHVAQRTIDTLRIALPNAVAPTPERLASLSKEVLIDGAPSAAWWERQAEDLQFKVAAEIRHGVLNGETTQQIVARVLGDDESPGLLDTSRRNARSLVHSSIMTAANRARLETFRKNARFAQGVRWLATLDGRTCLQCAALDGQAWDFDGKPLGDTEATFQLPPAHFMCRCVATPVAKSLDALLGVKGLDAKAAPATRASANGPTNAVTMDEFLKRQTPEFIDEMLGKRRAELWRAGKITLRDLVSGNGRPLTLAQLQAR